MTTNLWVEQVCARVYCIKPNLKICVQLCQIRIENFKINIPISFQYDTFEYYTNSTILTDIFMLNLIC